MMIRTEVWHQPQCVSLLLVQLYYTPIQHVNVNLHLLQLLSYPANPTDKEPGGRLGIYILKVTTTLWIWTFNSTMEWIGKII